MTENDDQTTLPTDFVFALHRLKLLLCAVEITREKFLAGNANYRCVTVEELEGKALQYNLLPPQYICHKEELDTLKGGTCNFALSIEDIVKEIGAHCNHTHRSRLLNLLEQDDELTTLLRSIDELEVDLNQYLETPSFKQSSQVTDYGCTQQKTLINTMRNDGNVIMLKSHNWRNEYCIDIQNKDHTTVSKRLISDSLNWTFSDKIYPLTEKIFGKKFKNTPFALYNNGRTVGNPSQTHYWRQSGSYIIFYEKDESNAWKETNKQFLDFIDTNRRSDWYASPDQRFFAFVNAWQTKNKIYLCENIGSRLKLISTLDLGGVEEILKIKFSTKNDIAVSALTGYKEIAEESYRKKNLTLIDITHYAPTALFFRYTGSSEVHRHDWHCFARGTVMKNEFNELSSQVPYYMSDLGFDADQNPIIAITSKDLGWSKVLTYKHEDWHTTFHVKRSDVMQQETLKIAPDGSKLIGFSSQRPARSPPSQYEQEEYHDTLLTVYPALPKPRNTSQSFFINWLEEIHEQKNHSAPDHLRNVLETFEKHEQDQLKSIYPNILSDFN